MTDDLERQSEERLKSARIELVAVRAKMTRLLVERIKLVKNLKQDNIKVAKELLVPLGNINENKGDFDEDILISMFESLEGLEDKVVFHTAEQGTNVDKNYVERNLVE